jgi:hypothetical protein
VVAFASIQEFANHMQATVTNSAATSALDIATARIQGATGQMFTYVTDDTVTLRGDVERLELPQRPVHSITSVTTTGLGETAGVLQAVGTSWMRDGATLSWLGGNRLNSSPALPYISYVWPYTVRVVYTHGYQVIPDDVKGCCLLLAAELYTSPDGTHYESIDDYAWRRGNASETPAALALKALKTCYGMGAHSVRMRLG